MENDCLLNNKKDNRSVSNLSKDKCCSCRSCEQICPKDAIVMEESYEGFIYPKVGNACINCGLCVKHCPVLTPLSIEKSEHESYATWLKDGEKLKESTSGGMFSVFAETYTNDGGIVFGCAYDKDMIPYQTKADNIDALKPIKGSKYVESDTRKSFSEVKRHLNNGRKILYSGTPCQIAGLSAFLGKEYESLLTMDLICHGVPSRKLFRKYLEWIGKRMGGQIIYYGFRDKDVCGWSCGGKIKTKTKTKTIDGLSDPYYWSFLQCETYRESCYACPYANINNRPADITIGDFFEVNEFYPDVDRTKGVSLLILNTEKGKNAFENVRNDIELLPIKQEQYLPLKGNLAQPSLRPKKRNFVYKNIDSENETFFRHLNSPFLLRLKMRVIKMVPKRIKSFLKRFM